MPLHLRIPCPQCGKILYRKRNGRCPECGTRVSAHVEEVRGREERIEKVVAVIGTVLVVLVLMLAGGVGLVEGILMYGGGWRGNVLSGKKDLQAQPGRKRRVA